MSAKPSAGRSPQDPPEAIPHEIAHRVTLSQAALQNVPSDDPGEPATGETATQAFTTAIGERAEVSRTGPVALRPPLEGDGWVDLNGYGAILNHHRYGAFAVNGNLRVNQRFARGRTPAGKASNEA